jgi:hypothetical protein
VLYFVVFGLLAVVCVKALDRFSFFDN